MSLKNTTVQSILFSTTYARPHPQKGASRMEEEVVGVTLPEEGITDGFLVFRQGASYRVIIFNAASQGINAVEAAKISEEEKRRVRDLIRPAVFPTPRPQITALIEGFLAGLIAHSLSQLLAGEGSTKVEVGVLAYRGVYEFILGNAQPALEGLFGGYEEDFFLQIFYSKDQARRALRARQQLMSLADYKERQRKIARSPLPELTTKPVVDIFGVTAGIIMQALNHTKPSPRVIVLIELGDVRSRKSPWN